MTGQPQHEYWAETTEPLQVEALGGVALVGHRQETDAYLLGLAAQRGQCLATLDRGLLTFAEASGLVAHVELVSAGHSVHEPKVHFKVTSTRGRSARPA